MSVSAPTTDAPDKDPAEPIWTPDADSVADAAITRFAAEVSARTGRSFASYADLWAWSVEHLEQFWAAVWDFFDIAADGTPRHVLADAGMPGARWFPGTELNYAEHALRSGAEPGRADTVAVTEIGEDGITTTTTWAALRAQVAAFAGWLRARGVQPGDRVVGYLPNSTPTLVAFLASASIGAVWAACGQDYSAEGAAARFAQLEPVVLVAADGYLWNGRVVDRRGDVAALTRALPTLRATVRVPHLGLHDPADPVGVVVPWREATATPGELRFERVPFDAPL
ncbi:MAG: acetoacetyl-CoA synthetase, partial [Pseudonocardiales bacterium]|nr:acetoacetyl-CoA synthetase [Pseudonocardiales bacterium]